MRKHVVVNLWFPEVFNVSSTLRSSIVSPDVCFYEITVSPHTEFSSVIHGQDFSCVNLSVRLEHGCKHTGCGGGPVVTNPRTANMQSLRPERIAVEPTKCGNYSLTHSLIHGAELFLRSR
jgi:hypothetical protein